MKNLLKAFIGMTLISTAPISINSVAFAETLEQNEICLDKLEEAALNLSYRARVAKDYVESELAGPQGRFYTAKAIRLTRALNAAALDVADLASTEATEEELLESFDEIESLFYQIDSTKRSLIRAFKPQRRDIETTFNNIRTAFYVYKMALTGSY